MQYLNELHVIVWLLRTVDELGVLDALKKLEAIKQILFLRINVKIRSKHAHRLKENKQNVSKKNRDFQAPFPYPLWPLKYTPLSHPQCLPSVRPPLIKRGPWSLHKNEANFQVGWSFPSFRDFTQIHCLKTGLNGSFLLQRAQHSSVSITEKLIFSHGVFNLPSCLWSFGTLFSTWSQTVTCHYKK